MKSMSVLRLSIWRSSLNISTLRETISSDFPREGMWHVGMWHVGVEMWHVQVGMWELKVPVTTCQVRRSWCDVVWENLKVFIIAGSDGIHGLRNHISRND